MVSLSAGSLGMNVIKNLKILHGHICWGFFPQGPLQLIVATYFYTTYARIHSLANLLSPQLHGTPRGHTDAISSN